MAFLAYAARRLAYAVIVIWLAATVIFVLIHAAPGDPSDYVLGRLLNAGQSFAEGQALVERYEQQFGLDKPLAEQYVAYLGQLARLNLGYSIPNFPTGVSTLIARALPYTIWLLVSSTLIAFTLGSVMGAIMAWRSSAWLARVVLPMFIVVAAIPYYLLALGLLYLFAYELHWLPIGGSASLLGGGGIVDNIRHAILPGLSVVLSATGFWMLSMRSSMIPVLGSDYLMLAEAKGLRARRVFLRYALRNALLPQVTGLAVALGAVVSGQVLVEVIFSYPGLGQLLLNAVNGRDYPVVQGICLMLIATVTIGVLIVDLLYPRIDPRISYERR